MKKTNNSITVIVKLFTENKWLKENMSEAELIKSPLKIIFNTTNTIMADINNNSLKDGL